MNEEKVNIPKFFHELFGTEQKKSDLAIVIFFTVLSGIIVSVVTKDFLMALTWYQNIVLFLLYIDIAGGVIANFTFGTDTYYQTRPLGRWVFIAIHIQPVLCAWVLGGSMALAFSVWGYTIASAIAINLLRRMSFQKALAGALLTLGLIGIVLISERIENILLIIYMMFMIKVIYSFAVAHHSEKALHG
ncbi:hypothetical protein HXA34_13960 [Salipaludibacillus agaradhaerens]|uniref:hypothetical protein n=1 Tax=Salipaludibacillus agaradhaerens TaxID=76935 RepID=UPI0021506CA7|nr:hypothetical protein [Salipaludibacillus agaradhaerens]MCR6107407.1 hypothetical protein [Salipaludibacillus agaradhaerens]MCR6119436.1 hypothetical protein [Salipaludibacillus agaradhaerens]UJW58464.1 hypothetical protein HXZ66_14095 [Bacillus sp. A116_S68]